MTSSVATRCLFALLLAVSCKRSAPAPTTESLFEQELQRRGVQFSTTAEGYKVATASTVLTINLENLRREYMRDRDPAAVVHFVDVVLSKLETPTWEIAKTSLYFAAQPSDYEFGDTIRRPVSKGVVKLLVHYDLEHERMSWITKSELASWGVTREQAESAAESNLARLLDGKRLEIDEIDGAKVGLMPFDSVFKASTIFAPNFKTFVTRDLEWPVLAAIPCRDFIYLFAETDRRLLNGIGSVVQREYRECAYPVTTEIFRISDRGIEAMGTIAP